MLTRVEPTCNFGARTIVTVTYDEICRNVSQGCGNGLLFLAKYVRTNSPVIYKAIAEFHNQILKMYNKCY